MKTCPTCGNKYRPDVTVCPNDGAELHGPALSAPPQRASAPPTGQGPPKTTTRAPSKPTSSGYTHDDISTSLSEGSSAKTWIVSLAVCLGLLGAFFVARGHLIPTPEADTVAAEEGTKKKGKRKRKKRKKRRKGAKRAASEANFDDYDWEQDFVADDREFGDVMSEPDEYEEVVQMREPERYEPTRSEWQPSGTYKPIARFAEPGADSDVVEIDLSSRSSSSPLDETQVNNVLDERKLARCYDPWVNKIPQMRGRVHMVFIVAGDGHVASVKLTRSQLRSRVVERCLVDKAKKFRFPRSQGGASTKFDTHFDFTNR